ncbi:MAG: HD domain-containing protein [Deltaproteobacteria bacterium]|nr:HD domain-containing protein [Deltaproteobacteria bacterium]
MTTFDTASAISALFKALPVLDIVSRTREAYLVGGAVRDILMGRIPLDYDIVVPEDPKALAKLIAGTGGSFFKMGKNRQAVLRGQFKDHTIDLVQMEGGSIESDLRLRDFTINAMAIRLDNRSFLDPMQGQKDLTNKTIRMISEQAFLSDPLRLLRAYRFAATLNFEIEKGTESAVKTHSRLIRRPAGERIREELIRLLAVPCAAGYLQKMSDSGLLFDLFPELGDEMACTQNPHHCFDVLDHTLNACRHLESFLNGKEIETIASLQIAINRIDDHLNPLLKLAMLLHDIGKPLTRSVDPAGAVHFWGHERKSAELAKEILNRLKFSSKDTEYLCLLIQNHLRPVLLYQAHQNQTLTRKGIVRLFRSLDTHAPDLLIHALADAHAKAEKACDMDPSYFGFIEDLLKSYFQDYTPRKSEAPLITGKDLITLFGLHPSSAFKIILEAVEEARLSQTLAGREDALALVRAWLVSNENEICRNRKND